MRRFVPPALAVLVAACAPEADSITEASPPPALGLAAIAPDPAGRCWGTDIQPAVIETVTVQEQATPAQLAPDGTVAVPATYRSVIRQQIARERTEVAFETLCPPAYTEEFVASLQRALRARGYYLGEPHGVLDTATGRAIQDFQRAEGPDSPLLSIRAARDLGLVALSPEEIDAL